LNFTIRDGGVAAALAGTAGGAAAPAAGTAVGTATAFAVVCLAGAKAASGTVVASGGRFVVQACPLPLLKARRITIISASATNTAFDSSGIVMVSL
jgi:hypothetical protein